MTSVAAKATIEFIEEEKLLENADTVGTYFRGKLDELQQKYPVIGDVRGKGLMLGLELVKDRQTKEPAPVATNQLLERTREHGLLIGKEAACMAMSFGFRPCSISPSPTWIKPSASSTKSIRGTTRLKSRVSTDLELGSTRRGRAGPTSRIVTR